MANGSLEHEARARQSHPEILEAFPIKSPVNRIFGDLLQAKTFSLTFTSSQWQLFWRLLNVGCMIADELLDIARYPAQTVSPDSARLWNELSAKLATAFQDDEWQRWQEEKGS